MIAIRWMMLLMMSPADMALLMVGIQNILHEKRHLIPFYLLTYYYSLNLFKLKVMKMHKVNLNYISC